MPFEFLTAFEGLAEHVTPVMQRALERALAAAAGEVSGNGRRFEARKGELDRLELCVVVAVVRSRPRSVGELSIRDVEKRGWYAEAGDELLLPVPYLPGQRSAAIDADATYDGCFRAVELYDLFQRAGLPLLLRAYYRETRASDVPPLSPVPETTDVFFRNREDILSFIVAEGLFDETYDGLRRRNVETLERLAQALVQARASTFTWQHLFRLVAEIRPRSFHPYLSMLAPGAEPEGLAFFEAQPAAVAEYSRLLEMSSTAPSATVRELEPGDLIAAGAFHESSRSTTSDTGAAMLALLRADVPGACDLVSTFLRRACDSQAAWEEAGYVALLANHAIGADLRVVPIAPWPCYQAIEQPAHNGSSTAHGSARGDATCSGCGELLVNILRIARADIASWARDFDLSIDTCPGCIGCISGDFDPYFVWYGPENIPSTVVPETASIQQRERVSPVARHAIVLEPAPTSRGRLSEGAAGCYARIGGAPSWLQPPRSVHCPRCARPMVFVGQTDRVPGDLASLILAFECVPCRIVGTTLERG
ncbi:MAG: hypothetical protein M4D80_00055 [Myxococcota bacterium]|nr:hypothetical protein [Deltaproteobacteria bacterium]MDQ3333546.1 hypothetical protein [Myxococcota bacterium]